MSETVEQPTSTTHLINEFLSDLLDLTATPKQHALVAAWNPKRGDHKFHVFSGANNAALQIPADWRRSALMIAHTYPRKRGVKHQPPLSRDFLQYMLDTARYGDDLNFNWFVTATGLWRIVRWTPRAYQEIRRLISVVDDRLVLTNEKEKDALRLHKTMITNVDHNNKQLELGNVTVDQYTHAMKNMLACNMGVELQHYEIGDVQFHATSDDEYSDDESDA